MNTDRKPYVVFIGAGNLATNLAVSLFNSGCHFLQVFSRSEEAAKLLANKVKSPFTTSLKDINQNADIYFICVPDKAIQEVADELSLKKGIVVHTSGSSDISLLAKNKIEYGVFYPFQTFSKTRIIPFNNIPICINANNDETFNKLNKVASLISKRVVRMDSTTLTWLHLSGVISNNFTNHLLAISYKLAEEKGFSYDLLKPLVLETIQKAFEGNPVDAQTGPAVRFDQSTINLHLEKLKLYSPELADIYKALTLGIQSKAKNKE